MPSEPPEPYHDETQTNSPGDVESATGDWNSVEHPVAANAAQDVQDLTDEEALARQEALAESHPWMFQVAVGLIACANGLACLALIIHHWAAYLCFLLPATGLCFLAVVATIDVEKRNSRIADLKKALTGDKQSVRILPFMVYGYVGLTVSRSITRWAFLRYEGGGITDSDGALSEEGEEMMVNFGVNAFMGLFAIGIYRLHLALKRRGYWRSKK